jgi:hypothetical protein
MDTLIFAGLLAAMGLGMLDGGYRKGAATDDLDGGLSPAQIDERDRAMGRVWARQAGGLV